jgi:hypothetical protein
MKVAVLGCGPSGLLAAHAVVRAGHEPVVFSRKQKSRIPGAVYLHEHIPGVSSKTPDGEIIFWRVGTRDGYAQKVYGNPAAPVSWDKFDTGRYPAWSMMRLYARLWAEYESVIVDVNLTEQRLTELEDNYALVISSIPAKAMCQSPYHFFNGTEVWISDEAQELCPDNSIMYNGKPDTPWYRTSRIFGFGATEYAGPVGPDNAVVAGMKPLRTNCTCHPHITRVGRFGLWEKGVLVHHAFKQAEQWLEVVGAAA